ncbi:hypothetical protein K438DRAFT_1968069 [Mycena galopus ATCC 62051]|nr:hypothetical protein K438DRAFT_1968069 [Mycena galopus ATCC 62051]
MKSDTRSRTLRRVPFERASATASVGGGRGALGALAALEYHTRTAPTFDGTLRGMMWNGVCGVLPLLVYYRAFRSLFSPLKRNADVHALQWSVNMVWLWRRPIRGVVRHHARLSDRLPRLLHKVPSSPASGQEAEISLEALTHATQQALRVTRRNFGASLMLLRALLIVRVSTAPSCPSTLPTPAAMHPSDTHDDDYDTLPSCSSPSSFLLSLAILLASSLVLYPLCPLPPTPLALVPRPPLPHSSSFTLPLPSLGPTTNISFVSTYPSFPHPSTPPSSSAIYLAIFHSAGRSRLRPPHPSPPSVSFSRVPSSSSPSSPRFASPPPPFSSPISPSVIAPKHPRADETRGREKEGEGI